MVLERKDLIFNFASATAYTKRCAQLPVDDLTKNEK
jgi:hypothetical protein